MTVTIVDAARPVTGGGETHPDLHAAPCLVTGGVDTHLDLNVAAALDGIGGLLGVAEFPATLAGHRDLLGWLAGFGPVARVGVEGTGSYGAGLARFLRRAGVEIVEVDRPNRQARRRSGKSDPLDAIEAARAALSGRACGAAKSRDGNVEAIRALVVAKRSARSTKIQTLNQIRHLSFTAPDELRQRLAGVSRQHLAAKAAALRPGSMREGADPVMPATKTALQILGRRVLALDEEKARIDALLTGLVTQTAPQLLALFGVGIDTAAALLVTAGDNPGRLRSEAAWAHLCGTAPIPASSGKVTRYRLSRGGDRQANRALWGIVITRLGNDPRTRAYMARRLAEGRSKPEVIRVLKRYVAREVYHRLPRP
jgi:transposase